MDGEAPFVWGMEYEEGEESMYGQVMRHAQNIANISAAQSFTFAPNHNPCKNVATACILPFGIRVQMWIARVTMPKTNALLACVDQRHLQGHGLLRVWTVAVAEHNSC